MEVEFSDRCVKNGIPEKTAKEVYAMIRKFAEYGFNKSHSACYARIAYKTAYLKAHYPECFMAANCTINANTKEKLIPCLAEIKAMGIEILPPSIDNSLASFSVENNDGNLAIRYGYEGLDRIGEDAAIRIQSLKDSATFFDFIKAYPEIRNNQLISLVNSGAFDKFGCRKMMCEIAPSIIEVMKYYQSIQKTYGDSLLGGLSGEDSYEGIEYGIKDKINKERQAIHICLSGHILEQIRPIIEGCPTTIPDLYEFENDDEVRLLVQINDINRIITKKGQPMAFLKIEDEFDVCEAVVFPKVYDGIEHLLTEDGVVILNGRLQIKEDESGQDTISVIVNTVEKAVTKPLRIYIEKQALKKYETEFSKFNGIAEVILIDTKKMSCQKQDYYIDYTKAVEFLNKHHISFIG